MKCSLCSQAAVIDHPALCREHFCNSFELRVKKTIKDHKLLTKKDKICVAASGGKDSLTLLFVLKKLGFSVDALVIDEGINNYREHTIKDLQAFCTKHNIALKIASFRDLVGKNLDDIKGDLGVKKEAPPCSACGTFRRHLMNEHAKGYDVIATGHNADDESQAVLMNLLRGHTDLLFRSGPSTGKRKGLVMRIKPLYFCSEKEIMTYALLQGYAGNFTECPYAHASYRARVRDVLNDYVAKNPGTRQKLLECYLSLRQHNTTKESHSFCLSCGAPSSLERCRACSLINFHTKKRDVAITTLASNNI